jgi:predicted Rossmann-fold nucleotide-binding protein
VEEGFLKQEHREMIVVESDPRTLLERLKQYAPGEGERLMGRTHR